VLWNYLCCEIISALLTSRRRRPLLNRGAY
jgi:hypothetical protein